MRRLTTTLLLLAGLTIPQPVAASDRWALTGWSWYYADRITLCLWQGAGVANPAGSGTAWKVPDEFRSILWASVDAWNRAGAHLGVRIVIVDRCTDRTDVTMLAFDEQPDAQGRWHIGQGGCDHRPDEGDWVHTAEACLPHGGVLLVNRQYPVEGNETFWLFAIAHELGHVLGLDHPGCSPACRDTVMSAGTCARTDQDYYCRTVPSEHDVAGLRAAYTGRGGGSPGCVPHPTVRLPVGHAHLPTVAGLAGQPPTAADSRGDWLIPPFGGLPAVDGLLPGTDPDSFRAGTLGGLAAQADRLWHASGREECQ